MDIKWALDKPFVELSGGWPRQTPLSCWRVVKLARARSLVLRSARLYGAQPPTHPAPLYSFDFFSANTPPALLMLWMRRLYVARQGEGELHQGCYIVCPWVQNRSHCHNNKGKAPKRELGSVRDVRGNVGDGRRHDLDAARENIFKTCVCVSLSLYLSLSVKTWMQLVGSFPRLATCSGLHIRTTASAVSRLHGNV